MSLSLGLGSAGSEFENVTELSAYAEALDRGDDDAALQMLEDLLPLNAPMP